MHLTSIKSICRNFLIMHFMAAKNKIYKPIGGCVPWPNGNFPCFLIEIKMGFYETIAQYYVHSIDNYHNMEYF